MEYFCYECGNSENFGKIQKEETYPVKGEPITIIADVVLCSSCGNTIYDDVLDSANLVKAYSLYCEKQGLLTPAQIKDIRSKYKLSQRGLSSLLGWSSATIARYEAGSIPSVAHNEQLKRIFDDSNYAYQLFQDSKNKFNKLEYKRVNKIFQESLLKKEVEPDLLLGYLEREYSLCTESFRGFKNFDIDKITQVAIFFSSNIQGLVKSKFLKLLWYSDFYHFKKYKTSITGAVYCHNHWGPIPLKHDALLNYLQDIDAIELVEYNGPYNGEIVKATSELDSGFLSDEELETVREVCEKFKGYTASNMTDLTHLEDGYIQTEMKFKIDYIFGETLRNI